MGRTGKLDRRNSSEADQNSEAKFNQELEKRLQGLDPETRKALEAHLKSYEAEEQNEKNDAIKNSKKEADRLWSDVLADQNNDLQTGPVIKREGKYERKGQKIDRINADQKVVISQLHEKIAVKDAMLVESFVLSGQLTRTRFEKGFAEMYRDLKYPNYHAVSKSEQKEMWKKSKAWADNVSDRLKKERLWDDLKRVSVWEKAEDRVEGRKQKATEYNEAETIFTESQLKEMLDTAARMMGKDEFAVAFKAKIDELRPNNNLPQWDNMQGFEEVLRNPGYSQYIRQFLKDNQAFFAVSGLAEWLDEESNPGELLESYRQEIEEIHGETLTNILQATYPDLNQAQIAKKRGEVSAQIAAGLMNVTNGVTGMKIRGAGLGTSVTFTGLDRVNPIVSRISIGAGITDKGVPGFAVDFGKDISWKTGGVHIDAGAANFIIPFARLGVDQTINMNALRKNLQAKRAWKVGAYAEAAPGYVGVGINAGNDLMQGIDHQERNIQAQLYNALSVLKEGATLDDAKQEIKKLFPRADEKTLNAAAQHAIDGIAQGYSWEDIAATFATAWRNEAIKNSKGKVDVSLEAGVGTLMTVPVLKAFVGLKIYKRATMLENKFDRSAKEQSLSTFRNFQLFDNSDVEDMSTAEKIAYWLGEDVMINETENTITIALKNPNTGLGKNEKAIYDKFDVYVKNHQDVIVSDNVITFSKASNILLGKLISSKGTKQKIYIGYDSDVDVEATKFPISRKINGKPEDVEFNTVSETIDGPRATESLSFSFMPRLDVADASFINRCTINKIDAFTSITHPNNKQRLTYNKVFGEFVASTRGTDFEAMKKNILEMNKYVKFFDANDLKEFETIWAKSNEHKRSLVNSIIQVGSYSARLEAIIAGRGLAGSKTVGELLKKRTGHLEAFKNSGIILDPKAFDSIYNKAKNIDGNKERYTEIPVENAVALVGYYRSGLTPTTGLIGFGDVHILAGKQYREDASKETDVYNKFLEIYQKSADYASQKAIIQKSVEDFATKNGLEDVELDDASFIKLLKGEKLSIKGVDLQMKGNTFEKILNGPCANEGYMLAFGKLEITYTTKTEKETPVEGDIYVGMEHVDNYQRAKSLKLGVGTMYGNKPKPAPQKPPYQEGKGETNPGDGTTPTIDDANGTTGVGDETDGSDTGDGSGNGE